jgi:S-adenosylmethionine hydrolase
LVTLTTDYGTRDHYVGAMKGVIASIAPKTRVVDITHEIEPFDVAAAAFVLWQTMPWFPAGSVHVAVVDPGVGTSRPILVAKIQGRYVVAPDNGLLTWVSHEFQVEALHRVEDPRYCLPQVSATFHGRDIMAPVAAHLTLGLQPAAFGPPAHSFERLPVPCRAERSGDTLVGQVIYVDRFGNLITNIHAEQLRELSGTERRAQVWASDRPIGELRSTFAEALTGEPLVYVGSAGFVEIAINQGRAAAWIGADTAAVRVKIVFA